MATGHISDVFRHLRRAALLSDGGGLTDGQLLECYLARREEAAFEALVRRHGPMVLGVCRRVLRNHHDAEDAFQATFLVLIRKASSILPPDRVGNWLYGVAYRTAMKAKAMSMKRRAKERQVADAPRPEVDEIGPELQPLLDRALNRLPDKYRAPVVLCDLEGKTRREAARQLGWPEGTVATRLAMARRMLAQRLARHGLLLAGGSLAVALAQNGASASAPTPLVISTVKAATVFAAGQVTAASLVSAKVAALTERVLKGMLMSKLKTAMAVLLVLGVIGLGVGAGSYKLLAGEEADAKRADRKGPAEKPTTEEKADGRLPFGPMPIQALVSLAKDGRLAVKRSHTAYQPKEELTPDGRKVLSYRLANLMTTQYCDLTDIEVLDNKGKRIDKDRLPERLKEEVPALVYSGPREIDPLHLRLIKDGILVFVLPYYPPIPPPAPSLAPVPLVNPPIPLPAPSLDPVPVVNPPIPPPAPSLDPVPVVKRVGQIMIVGNEKMSADMILKEIQLYPGQIFSYPDLRKAERNLERLNLFEINPKEGIRPTVTVVESDSAVKDILVKVKEKGGAAKK